MRYLLLFSLLFGLLIGSNAQDASNQYRYSVQAGVGLTMYVNSLKLGGDRASTNHVGYSFAVMREFEHRLAIGLETGYYRFYEVTAASPQTGEATLSITPIMIKFRMKVVTDFYLSAGTGISILSSTASALGSSSTGSQTSLANFQVSALYLKQISNHFRIGGELKFMNVGKTEDNAFALQLVASYLF